MTSLKDHMSLALALEAYRRAMGSDAGRVAQEAARTALLTAAEPCGYDGGSPILLWADEAVRTYANRFPKSGRDLDQVLRRLPRVDLERLLGERPMDPHAPVPSRWDAGSLA